jgi:hypothetical protein
MSHHDPGRPGYRSAVVLAAMLVAFGSVRAWRTARENAGIDYYQYWVVGKVLGRGEVASIYRHDSRAALGREFLWHALAGESERQRAAARVRTVLEPMSTPFLFTVLSPFALGAYEPSLDLFLALSLACLLASILVFGRVVAMPLLERLLVLALLVFVFQPVAADLRVGNVGQLQLGLVALYVWLSAGFGTARQAPAGIVLGAATAFKPNLAAVAPLLLASWAMGRQWRRLVAQGTGFVAGALASLLVSAGLFGSLQAWPDWLAAVRAGDLPLMPMAVGNVSLLALGRRWTGLDLGPLPGLAGTLAVVLALWLRRRVAAPRLPAQAVLDDLPVAAAGCLLFLLSSPLVWQHYLMLALPAVMVLLGTRPGWRWITLAALTAVAIDPYADLFGLTNPPDQAIVVAGGLFLLFVLVLAEIAAPAGPLTGTPAPS